MGYNENKASLSRTTLKMQTAEQIIYFYSGQYRSQFLVCLAVENGITPAAGRKVISPR